MASERRSVSVRSPGKLGRSAHVRGQVRGHHPWSAWQPPGMRERPSPLRRVFNVSRSTRHRPHSESRRRVGSSGRPDGLRVGRTRANPGVPLGFGRCEVSFRDHHQLAERVAHSMVRSLRVRTDLTHPARRPSPRDNIRQCLEPHPTARIPSERLAKPPPSVLMKGEGTGTNGRQVGRSLPIRRLTGPG